MFRGVEQVCTYVLICVRITVLVVVALFVPRLGIVYMQSRAQASECNASAQFKLGVENITHDFLISLTPRGDISFTVGLITNQSGCDQAGRRTLDILLDHGVPVKKIFVPEHGLDGTIKNHLNAETEFIDQKTGTPVVMLYDKWTTKILDKKLLEGIDVLFFDIQEMGIRHNTYLTTLFQAIESAAVHKKKLVVLDRPNILGSCMEGPLVEDGLKSSISYASIPVRHGMTIGELAIYFNTYCAKPKADLRVLTMENYNRYQTSTTAFPARLSPNINSTNACYGYSFLGMLAEVRPFDVALGTDKAFQCIALPDSIKFSQKQWYELRDLLKESGVETCFHRYFSERKKQYCSGLLVHINDMNTVSSFKSLLSVLSFFKKSGIELKFSKLFDLAVGTRKVREFLEGSSSKYELETTINAYLHDFFAKASSVFKYRPYPYLVRL